MRKQQAGSLGFRVWGLGFRALTGINLSGFTRISCFRVSGSCFAPAKQKPAIEMDRFLTQKPRKSHYRGLNN